MVPMAGTLTAAVGAATGIQDSSRSSEAASRSLLPPAGLILMAPASSHTEVPTLPRSDIPGRNLDSDDGGYMDVEGTASPPDRLASDVSLITDTGFRQESDDSLISDFDGGHSSTAVASAPPPQGRRVSMSLRQISDL